MRRAEHASLDRIFSFVAFMLSRRVPISIPDIARETGYSRANAYRLVERMKAHFPVQVTPGKSLRDRGCVVVVRRSNANG